LSVFKKKNKPRRVALEDVRPQDHRKVDPEVLRTRKLCMLVTVLLWLLLTKMVLWGQPWGAILPIGALLLGIGAATFYIYVRTYHAEIVANPPVYFGITLLMVLALGGTRLLISIDESLTLAPILLVGMFFALTRSGRLAVVGTFFELMAITLILAMERLPELQAEPIDRFFRPLFEVWSLMPACLILVLGMWQVRNRTRLIKAGFFSGVAAAVTVFAAMVMLSVLEGGGVEAAAEAGYKPWWAPTAKAWLNGVATGFVITGLLPFLEKWLGITTDISLLELSDLNQPLLRQLQLKAPGTYHHSLIMSSLAEAAAEKIGANALLARVGCYYHDIGKTLKPEYFVENMDARFESKHKNLAPTMSTLIIISHVKDGMELAEYYGLPIPIRDFIATHHGTSVVEFFYREALEKNTDSEGDSNPSRESFRYPGPKPKTRETGIVMLADSVEAAARSLGDPSPSKLEGLVHDIIMRKLNDAQLNECGLTMRELKDVEESFLHVLAGIYHGRIKYPGQVEFESQLDQAESEATSESSVPVEQP
jgi:putative nucleotidyltransferase with HDIG domain